MITSHQVTLAESVGWHGKPAGTLDVASLSSTLYIEWHIVMPRSRWLYKAKATNSSTDWMCCFHFHTYL